MTREEDVPPYRKVTVNIRHEQWSMVDLYASKRKITRTVAINELLALGYEANVQGLARVVPEGD